MHADKAFTPPAWKTGPDRPPRTAPGAGRAAVEIGGVVAIMFMGCWLALAGRPVHEVLLLLFGVGAIGAMTVRATTGGDGGMRARASAIFRAAREPRP